MEMQCLRLQADTGGEDVRRAQSGQKPSHETRHTHRSANGEQQPRTRPNVGVSTHSIISPAGRAAPIHRPVQGRRQRARTAVFRRLRPKKLKLGVYNTKTICYDVTQLKAVKETLQVKPDRKRMSPTESIGIGEACNREHSGAGLLNTAV